jgi:hypothetical protein
MNEPATPTVADVVERLNAILLGDASRAAVAAWAAGWIAREPSPIADPAVWQLLRLAASTDLRTPSGAGGEGEYLHSDGDLRDWIDGAAL